MLFFDHAEGITSSKVACDLEGVGTNLTEILVSCDSDVHIFNVCSQY